MSTYAPIVGWGRYVPTRVLTNEELAPTLGVDSEWIEQRTGVRERRVAAPDETTSSLGARAARAALEVAGLEPTDVDLVILATVTPDHGAAATASVVQAALGASRAAAFDMNAGCSGFVYALVVASGLIQSGIYRTVVVVGAETLSRFVDYSDPNTCVLFGDGAGAVVLRASERKSGLLASVLGSDGKGAETLYIPAGGSRLPTSHESVEARQHFVKMNGLEVFKFAVSKMGRVGLQAVEAAGLRPDEIDLFVPHQANARIIQSAARALRLPTEKVFVNIERYGNTSSASIPIALCEAVEQGRLRAGNKIALVGFGAGLSWAGAVLQWGDGAEV